MEWTEIKDILFIAVLAGNLLTMIITVLIPLVIGVFIKRNWWKKINGKEVKLEEKIKKIDLKIKKLQLEKLENEKK